jgi:hypothetical protein
MSSDVPPVGQRFSHIYGERGTPQQDSPRMRHRLAVRIDDFPDLRVDLSGRVEQELGIPGPTSTGRSWTYLLERWDLKDVLDLITIVYRHLSGKARTGIYEVKAPNRWLAETRRILSEENVHYRVDDGGGVHFHIDEEFARNRAATIAALQSPRYANTLHAFEGSLTALSQAPPDGKGAIRATFAAMEGLFKLIFPNEPRLTAKATGKLRAVLQSRNASDGTALQSSLKMLNSFAEWIDAAHFYRHEQRSEEVAQPPLELTVYIVSTGAAHLRWLAGLDDAASLRANR